MKIAIFGIGAIGGYIAGRLTNAGEEVSLISRGETLKVIRSSGLTIHNENKNYINISKINLDNMDASGIKILLKDDLKIAIACFAVTEKIWGEAEKLLTEVTKIKITQ